MIRPVLPMLATALALALPAAAPAEVLAADPAGITVQRRVTVAAEPRAAYAAFGRVGRWWLDSHTYSGKAANLSLAAQPGGCFCERWPDGAIEHGRVLLAMPGKQLVLASLLGPAMTQATAGTLRVDFAPARAGGSEVTLTYRLTGLADPKAMELARVIDMVLGQQLDRYAAYAVAAPPRTSVTKR